MREYLLQSIELGFYDNNFTFNENNLNACSYKHT